MPDNDLQAEDIKRLRWQCRRGIKEVEVLLVPFFEQVYPGLNAAAQLRFQQLLEQHDVDLFEWFTLRSQPEQVDLKLIVEQLLAWAQGGMNGDA